MSRLKPLEHKIKAMVYGVCRLFLKRGRRGQGQLDPALIKKVLFLRPEKIGDMVISLPVFDTLKNAYPNISVSVLASPRSLALVKDDPRFESVFLYRKNLWPDIKELLAIRREKFDCIFDMIDDDSVTTLFYSQLAGSDAIRIGIGKSDHACYYDYNHVHADGIGQHIIDNTMKLLEPFGLDQASVSGTGRPYVSDDARELIDQFLQTDRPVSVLVIGLNLSAGKPNRVWPADCWVELCRQLIKSRDDLQVVIITAPNERQRGIDLQSQFRDRAMLVPEQLGLMEVSALISKLNLLVSPDTSLIHIARAFEVPVVGLYSRATKNFKRWQPYRQTDGAVVGDHEDNIHDISVASVLERLQVVLKRIEAEAVR